MKNATFLFIILVASVLIPEICSAQHCKENPKGIHANYRKFPRGLTEVTQMTYLNYEMKEVTIALGDHLPTLGKVTGMFVALVPDCFTYANSNEHVCIHEAPIMGPSWAASRTVRKLISYTTCSGKKVYFKFNYPTSSSSTKPAPKRRARPVRRRPSK